MNAKFIIAPVIALTAVAGFFLTQQEPDIDSTERSADKPLNLDSSAAQSEAPKQAVAQKIDPDNSDSNKALGSKLAQIDNEAPRDNDLEDLYPLVSDNEDYPTLASRMDAIKARRPNLEISPEAVMAALEKTESWEATQAPQGKVKEKLTEEQLNDGRTFLEFDRVKVETLMPGDHMYVAIEALGTAYDMKVDEIKDFYDGNLMWRGSLINVEGTEAEGGTVTITQSSNITVASVVLREKAYSLESYGTDGWIANSAALWKFDPNVSDAEIPSSKQ